VRPRASESAGGPREADSRETREPASQQHWHDTLRLSNVTLFAQDSELRYLWMENAPAGVNGAAIKGLSDRDIMPEAAAQRIESAKREVLASGKGLTIEFQWPVGPGPKWYELKLAPVRDAAGHIKGLQGAVFDISERKQSETHLRILLLELAHRSKNLLAVIQGISNQTAKSSESIDEFTRRFTGRLMSLSRAHDILSDQNWRGAGMRELIRTQVLLFAGAAGDRVDYEGDAIYLRPNAAQHIGLALHELTANALKHGALSTRSGRVKIRWALSGEQEPGAQTFSLSWEESGGPAVRMPETKHFGRILLEEVAPLSVQGRAKLDFAAGGIIYEMSMPMSELS
jgi:two-component sensor histidine kinase